LDTTKELSMKLKLVVAGALLFAMSAIAWGADHGATLYKKKCAGCHGATGEGKGKTPALKGKQMETSQIVDQITKGKPDSKPPHTKGIAGLTPAQAQAIAEYIKSLQ
jgi:mono/diheme cytochrome c family protein